MAVRIVVRGTVFAVHRQDFGPPSATSRVAAGHRVRPLGLSPPTCGGCYLAGWR